MNVPLEPTEPAQQEDLAARVERSRWAWRRLGMRIRSITPSRAARLLLVILALYGLARLVGISWDVLAPFVVGLALAYLLLPLVNLLSRHLPRWAAILLVFVSLILLLGAAWAFIIPPLVSQGAALLGALPSEPQIQEFLMSIQQAWSALDADTQKQIGEVVGPISTTLRDSFIVSLQGVLNFIIGGLFTVFNLLGFLLGLVIVPFFVYYVLKDHDKIPPAIDHILPGWMRPDFWAVVRIFDRNFSSYLRGQLLLVLVGAAATFLGLLGLSVVGIPGVQYRLLLAVFAGLTVLIPYVGFVIAVLAAFGVGALTSWQTALAMAVVVFVVKQVVDTMIYPVVVGRSVHLHEAIVLIVLVVLSEFGLIWVILAPPVAAVARDLFVYAYGRFDEPPRPAGVLPGEPLPVAEEAPRSAEAVVEHRSAMRR